MSDAVDRARNILERLRQVVAQDGADQATADDLDRLISRLIDPVITLVMVGVPKGGKSSLINALAGALIVPVDFQVATAVPIVVRYGDHDHAVAYVRRAEGRAEIPLAQVPEYAAVSGSHLGAAVLAVEIECRSDLLASGLEVVDTPGIGGLDADHSARTLRALERADAALMVLDAHQPISAPELDFLEQAASRAGLLLFAVNKIDDRPKAAWSAVLREDERVIATRLGCRPEEVTIIAVSAADAARSLDAADHGDHERAVRLLRASRIGELASAIRSRVLADGNRQRLLGTIAHCAPIISRHTIECENLLTTDAARLAELAGHVRFAQQDDARWRAVCDADFAALAKDVQRVGASAVNLRMKMLRTDMTNGTAGKAMADRAVLELAAIEAELVTLVESRLPRLIIQVADELAVDGLADLIAEFDPRLGARSLRPSLSEEDVEELGTVLIQGAMQSAQAAFLAYRMTLPALRAAGIAARGATAIGAGAAGAGAATSGTVAVGTFGTVAGTSAAGTAAAGTAVVAAGAVAILVGVVVVGVAFHRYRTRKQAAEAQSVYNAAEGFAGELIEMIIAGVEVSRRNLVELVDLRLKERARSLRPDPVRRADAEKRLAALAEIERDRIALRTELANR